MLKYNARGFSILKAYKKLNKALFKKRNVNTMPALSEKQKVRSPEMTFDRYTKVM